jgi:isopenicillin N synthase-like dioxygenase
MTIWLSGSDEERGRLAVDLRHILYEHGFFYLSGHGVDPGLIEQTLDASRRFFALPEKDKLEIAMIRSPQFRGYTRAGAELTQGQPDWREQVDFDREEAALPIGPGTPAWKGTIGPNQWPSAMPELKPIILRYQEEDVFEPMIHPLPRQHLKILRYPGHADAESRQGVGAHKDGGLVTILLQDKLPGL